MDNILYKHNQIPYKKIKQNFQKTKRVCIISPTGTGKSFLFIKWFYDNRYKKCLFITSNYTILDQFKKSINKCGILETDLSNLQFCLYSSLKSIVHEKYDFIG